MSAAYYLSKEQHVSAFDRAIAPALEIDSGDTVSFETPGEVYRRLANGETPAEIGFENLNLVVGPVFVRGAEPGDALKIEVLDIQVRQAWSVWIPHLGGLGGKTDALKVREIELREGRAYITGDLSIPLRPMIGCIGVAPADGIGSTFRPAYRTGGNMDLREMEPGTTLFLPVDVPGALLSVGDLHAAMGTSEPTSVALEAPGTATLRISVEKGMHLNFPRLRVGTSTICVGIADTPAEARQIAINEAYDLLVMDRGLLPFDAYSYISGSLDLRLGGPASSIILAVVEDIAVR